MVITNNQMSTCHKLKDEKFKICCKNIKLETVGEWKLLGVTIGENLTLNKHLSLLPNNCYCTHI